MNIAAINQQSEIERVKEKIRKLSVKTVANGATEAEANSAMEMVGKLLDHYDLELNDILLSNEKCVYATFKSERKSRSKIDLSIPALAEYCDCIVYWDRDLSVYVFFGLESDTMMALYLTDYIHKAILSEVEKYKKTDSLYLSSYRSRRKTLSTEFMRGMCTRLSSRLRKMKKHRDADIDRKEEELRTHMGNNSTSMIHIRKKKEEKVKADFQTTGVKIVRHRSYIKNFSQHAREAGFHAASNVNLNRPINSGGQQQKLLA